MGGARRRDGLDVDVAVHAVRRAGAGVARRALAAGFGAVGRAPAAGHVCSRHISVLCFQPGGAPRGRGVALRRAEALRGDAVHPGRGHGGHRAHGGFSRHAGVVGAHRFVAVAGVFRVFRRNGRELQ